MSASVLSMPLEEIVPERSSLVTRIYAKPFVYRDPRQFPRREWLYGRHYIRRYVSGTIAPGGLGKSSLVLAEAVAMASGRKLLGPALKRPLRVWYWNGEDDLEEIERRVLAILIGHGIGPEEVEGRLFLNSGRDDSIFIATAGGKGPVSVDQARVDGLIDELKTMEIDVMIFDPFVSTHAVNESDNGAIDRVAKTFAYIAHHANIAIELVHHVRKPGNGQGEFTADDARGASSLLGALRSVRILNPLTATEAVERSIPECDRFGYFRVNIGKSNMAPRSDSADWFELRSISIGNSSEELPSDNVPVVFAWQCPDLLAELTVAHLRAAQQAVSEGGPWREHPTSTKWVGIAIARVLGVDHTDKIGKHKDQSALRLWIKNGMFVSVVRKDERRKEKVFIEVGEWATD